MLVKKKVTKAILIIGIVLLIFISPIFSNMLSFVFPDNKSEGPIYDVAIAAETQQNIWKLCEDNDFSYELLLSIYHEDGIGGKAINEVEKDLKELVYIRDYWAGKEYADEDVFDFTIISWDLGIEECEAYMEEYPAYKDNEYLVRVTEYKYALEKSRYDDCTEN